MLSWRVAQDMLDYIAYAVRTFGSERAINWEAEHLPHNSIGRTPCVLISGHQQKGSWSNSPTKSRFLKHLDYAKAYLLQHSGVGWDYSAQTLFHSNYDKNHYQIHDQRCTNRIHSCRQRCCLEAFLSLDDKPII